MLSSRTLALALLGVSAAGALAGEMVGVNGSVTQFATPIDSVVNGKPVKMTLTGTAMRKRFFFNVYALGSYLQDGVSVHSAEELVARDCAKKLHLVMERDVEGKDMAEAFQSAIRLNYPAPAFESELKALTECIQAQSIKKGDHVWLTHLPGVGMHCQLVDKTEVTIKNVAFARAVWEIYLGKNNLGEAIKTALVSRL